MPHQELQFWQVNVPLEKLSNTCPEFLLECCEKDQRIIGTPDSEYQILSWLQVQDLIRSNRVDLFQRVPSQLRRYRQFTSKTIKEYGSLQNFVLKERLRWTSTAAKASPFVNSDDIKILFNDWPYGIDEKIVHLVIWTKFELKDDPIIDDLTPETRRQINDWVERTFGTHMNPQHVAWFRNWKSIKSVHAIEHFHVMLYDPDTDLINSITGGDAPLSAKAPTHDQDL